MDNSKGRREFPFYEAKREILETIQNNQRVHVVFDDGGYKIDWEGTKEEFFDWFDGDVITYFRNNYNDEGNRAYFSLLDESSPVRWYKITISKSLFGKSDHIPFGSIFQYKGAFPFGYRDRKLIEKTLKYVEKCKEKGISTEEIKKRINNAN